MATQNYTAQDVKGIKESFDNSTKIVIDSFKALPVFDIEDTTQYSEIYTSTESFSGMRELAEEETPDTNKLNEGAGKTLTAKRYGNSFTVTTTDMQKFKDGSVMVDKYLLRQSENALKDARNFFVQYIHDFYNNGFVTTYNTAPDSVALFGTHSWSTPGSTDWVNAATTALSETAVDTAMAFGGNFKDGSDHPMPQTYDTIFVKTGGSAAIEAKKRFAENIKPVAVNDVNIYHGVFKIVESPYLTSSTAWFMLDTKQNAAPVHIGVLKYPTMEDPIRQNNGSDRVNIEAFFKGGIPRLPMNSYGSTGLT